MMNREDWRNIFPKRGRKEYFWKREFRVQSQRVVNISGFGFGCERPEP